MAADTPGWITAGAAAVGTVVPWILHARRTGKRLDQIEHQQRLAKRDIRRLERFARRIADVLFDVRPQSGRRRYDRSFEVPPDDDP